MSEREHHLTKADADAEVRSLRERLAGEDSDWARALTEKLSNVAIDEETLPQQGISSSELNSGGPRLKARAELEAADQPTNVSPHGETTAAEERERTMEERKKAAEERAQAIAEVRKEVKEKADAAAKDRQERGEPTPAEGGSVRRRRPPASEVNPTA